MAQQQEENTHIVDEAVAEGGAYELIRKRLEGKGSALGEAVTRLNESRLVEFGGSEMSLAARIRVRTENNCIARDIVQVGDNLLFGYNVFIGLKKETRVADVFSLFRISGGDSGYEIEPVPVEGSFLDQPAFRKEFEELYRYYKHTRLVQLTIRSGRLLAGFQIGEQMDDLRVFRWAVSADSSEVSYLDNRGERDIQMPAAHDFEWIETTREDSVNGRHPHVNILDTIFVETIGGNLTIKIENNTEDGLGIFSEPVEDKTQALYDADILYARIGSLILLKIRPYREEQWRSFAYNTLMQTVIRVDAISDSCVQLPEDHGIVFPGGYYLQNGEYKTFGDDLAGLKTKRVIRSPNGEDVLYVFYERERGTIALLGYNLIRKEIKNPISGHGYAIAHDGTIVIFSAESEPTRVHPMQVWTTPYVSVEYASQTPTNQTFLGRIGNAELVRGISDLLSVYRMIENQEVSVRIYEELSRLSHKLFDDHYWVEDEKLSDIAGLLREISSTAELVIDEFEKVESIRQQSIEAVANAEQKQQSIIATIQPDSWELVEQYVEALDQLRHQRGHLTTIREYRYIDITSIDKLEQVLIEQQGALSNKTVEFLASEGALRPYLKKIDDLNRQVEKADTIAALTPPIETIESTASALDLLSELMATLKMDDATVRTRITEDVSSVYSK